MILDIPRFKCLVRSEFLSDGKETGYIEAYCFAITLIESRPLLFTVHTEHGAIYSRLPIYAIEQRLFYNPQMGKYFKEEDDKAKLDPWGAISSKAQVIKHQYLKDYEVQTIGGVKALGVYWCTIDYFGEDFSQDPEQHKTTNIIMLYDGHIAAMPNNYCLFKDRHFTSKEKSNFPYQRNEIYYTL
jgi:hypothetical protein